MDICGIIKQDGKEDIVMTAEQIRHNAVLRTAASAPRDPTHLLGNAIDARRQPERNFNPYLSVEDDASGEADMPPGL